MRLARAPRRASKRKLVLRRGRGRERYVHIQITHRPQQHHEKKRQRANPSTMRSGTAQSFLESVDSVNPAGHESKLQEEGRTDTGSCACCCRCGRVQKWKMGPRGRRSKSYTSLRTGISELSGWESEPTKAPEIATPHVAKSYVAGQAPLERLPMEILGKSATDMFHFHV